MVNNDNDDMLNAPWWLPPIAIGEVYRDGTEIRYRIPRIDWRTWWYSWLTFGHDIRRSWREQHPKH